MTTKTWGRNLTFCLPLALLVLSSQFALPHAAAQDRVGELTVTGSVKVNGQPAATGDIVAPASEVETAKGSSAVVSLGKLGRVEALPETAMKLRWDNSSISVAVSRGSVRVDTGPGVTASVKVRED